MKKLILLVTIGFLFYSCSKDDSQTTEEQQTEIVQGGDIFLSQVVIIDSENINLEEYSATLGELNIKALKSSDNEIMFLVPSNFNIGQTIFEISELNIKINYEIKQPVLLETVEETIQPFIDNISSIETDITSEPNSFRKQNVLNAIALFDERMTNATDQEKLRLAEFYQINKTLIDEIYTTDYTTVLSRDYSGLGDSEAFNNFAISVGKALAFSGLSYLSFSIPSPDLFTKLLALGTAVVAIKAWYDAYDLFYECRNRKIFTIDFQIDNIQSSLSGNNNNFIEYYHNTEQENAILRLAKELDESNSNSTITNVSNFFENLNVLDNIIEKVNFVINKINQYNPFSQIENIPDAILNNATITSKIAEDNLLNTISYSVSNNNVQVDYLQFDNGNMKTKLSIIDQSAVSGEYIETTLNFTYQDDFNDISGSYPIKVFKEEQVEGWYQVNYNLETGSGASCGPQSGKEIKFYVNLLENNGDFSGTIYYREIDDVFGIPESSFSIEPFSSFNSNQLGSSSESLNGDTNGIYSLVWLSLYINTDGTNLQAAYGINMNQNYDPNVCYTQAYGATPIQMTYIGTNTPSDL